MAEYNVDIQVRAKTKQVETELTKLQKRLDNLSKAASRIDFKTPEKAMRNLGRTARKVGNEIKSIFTRGLFAGAVVGAGQLPAAFQAATAKLGPLQGAVNAVGNAFDAALGGVPHLVGEILTQVGHIPGSLGMATVAAMAFAPQLLKASSAAVGVGAAVDKAIGKQVTEAIAGATDKVSGLNTQLNATKTAFADLIKGSTLNQLNKQLQDANHQIGKFHSTTEEARTAASQLVAVTKAQTAEQRAINDLVRQARGISQTELQESKAIKSLETKRRQQAYLTEEADKYNREIDEYNRLAKEAAQVTKQWESSLLSANRAAKAGVFASRNQMQARLQEMRENRQSVDIARQRSAQLMGISGEMQGPQSPLGAMARAEANRIALRQQSLRLLDQERQKAQQNLQLMQNWTAVLKEGVGIQGLAQRQRAQELQDRKEAFAISNRELQFELKLQAVQEKRTRAQTRSTNQRSALSNALVGGAFPLLFGQTGAAAIGGAIGGAAGGLLGGTFGFGLSLLGTAIGDIINKAQRLNSDLLALNASVSSTGFNSTTTASDVKELASALRLENDAVLELLNSFKQFTDGNTREALTSIFSGVGDATTFENLAKAAINQKNALSSIFALRKEIGNAEARSLALNLSANGALTTQKSLTDLIVENSIKAKVATASQVTFWDEITGRLTQGVVLLAEFVKLSQEAKLPGLPDIGLKVPGIDAFIKKFKEVSPESIAKQRGEALEKTLRDNVQKVLKALEEETELLKIQYGLEQDMSGKRDTTLAQLQIELALKKQLYALSIKQGEAKLGENTTLMDALAMEGVLLEREAAIKSARLESKNQAEETLRIQLATVDADQKLLGILQQRKTIVDALNDRFTKTLEGLDFELQKVNAISEGEQDALRVREIAAQYKRDGKTLDETEIANLQKKIEAIRAATNARKEEEAMQQRINTLVNTAGQQFTGLFETLVNGTNDWNSALRNVLTSLSSALLRFGLSSLGGSDGVGLFSILSGTFTGGKPRALGGQVSAGKPYTVGERGPELFVPGAQGNIVPNNAMGGANVTVNVDASGSNVEGNADQANQLGKAIGLAVQQELIKQKRPGGLLAGV